MSATPIAEARPPRNRLALVGLVAALYASVAAALALVLNQLALAAVLRGGPQVGERCAPVAPPVAQLLFELTLGLWGLIISALSVAIVSGHLALSRMGHQAAPKYRRNVALWSLILGYGALLTLLALAPSWVWAGYTFFGD